MIDHYCPLCQKYWLGDLESACPNCWGEARLAKPDMEAILDNVNHPAHYLQGGIECIDAIKAALTSEEWSGYCKGNALKYIWRCRHKGGDEDLAKASWYLNKLQKGGSK